MRKYVTSLNRYIAVGLAFAGMTFALFASAWLTPVLVAPPPTGESEGLFQVKCSGPWNGVTLTQAQLDQVLSEHKAWLDAATSQHLLISIVRLDPYEPIKVYPTEENFAEKGYASPLPPSTNGPPVPYPEEGRADLCGARIVGLTFRRADLRYARLMGARIISSDLNGVNFGWGNLEMVGIWEMDRGNDQRIGSFHAADLKSAIFTDSNFRGWSFTDSDARFAHISGTNFADTVFDDANLGGIQIDNVDLSNASLKNTNLAHATLNIQPGHLPQPESLRDAQSLTSVTANGGAQATLAELRDKLDSLKMSVPAAEINYAINHQANMYEASRETARSHFLQTQLNWLLLGVPYEYGLRPERLLIAVGLVILSFWLLYLYAIFRSELDNSIWIARPAPRSDASGDKTRATRLMRTNCNPFFHALWFSVLSAFRIGWGNVSVGEWIARLQTRGYEFHAVGWPRTVAGMQSLLSVYLLALAISKYLL